MRFSRDLFEKLAEEALAEIPRRFCGLLTNLEIAVKSAPGREAGRWQGSRTLLGLYTGLKREEMRSPLSGTHLPARILLYQRNIEALCGSQKDLARQIRLTLRHEIAHHFGFSEAKLRKAWPEGA